MTWQWVIIGAVVGLAATYLGWRMVRFWRGLGKGSCGGGCGCGTTATPAEKTIIPVEQVMLRRREP